VIELAALQRERGQPDNDFARGIGLPYSGSTWGKIKNGTHAGNADKALRAVAEALARAKTGGQIVLDQDTESGCVVILPHMRDAEDAAAIARTATDEHRLVVLVGASGSGKSVTARRIARMMAGNYMHARPSWGRSYMQMLTDFARGVGMSASFPGSGQAEAAVLAALTAAPRLIVIDEANHFSRDGLNFLKTILNETPCVIVLCTLPNHLARCNADHNEETRQLIRRAVAVIHIPAVNSETVLAMACGLYPEVRINGHAPAVASASNRHHGMDTVRRIFEETAPGDEDDLVRAVERVDRMIRAAVR
jgi:hypothetical protein